MAGHLLFNDGTALQTPSLCSLSPTPPHPTPSCLQKVREGGRG